MPAPDRLATALADRYRIERELGAGGMATVYLAEDLKHKRKVAIKVLKPELAAVLGAERFVQEITTTAALSHPHILPLFDSGEAGGFLYYVMPYIQGETIREKLNRETQFGIEEALKITTEVADALDYAHQNGVIHRDIKPENILLHNGRPMVMDFGIALAVSAAAGGRMTETGLSLGTPHYMSPEQATADKAITARSDVYSLASVCYEMLAGEPPHTGGSAQAIIMKIIAERAQPVTELRGSAPANVAAALAKALEKVPADRFASAKAFSTALADVHFASGSNARAALVAAGSQRTVVWSLVTALGVVSLVAGWALLRPRPAPPVYRHALQLPDEQQPDEFTSLSIASDGSRIGYIGRSPRSPAFTLIWLKSRNELEATPLPGTEGATTLALSPDGQEVIAVQRTLIRRFSIAGGTTGTVADDAGGGAQSLAWLDDNTIVYVSADGRQLKRVPAAGGASSVLWTTDSLTLSSLVPLPGARGLLFQACRSPCSQGNVWVLDLRSGAVRELLHQAWAAFYLSSGHLAYVTERDLSVDVVAFDLKTLQAHGQSVSLVDSVTNRNLGPYISVSPSGTLAMIKGTTGQSGEFALVWVDRSGRESPVDTSYRFRVTQTAGNFGWSISPDGTRLAIGLNSPDGDDIFVKALPRGPATRLTFGPKSEARPRWTADGRAVTFVSNEGVSLRRADGTGTDSLLWNRLVDEAAISPDGKWLVVRAGSRGPVSGGRDINGIRLGEGNPEPVPLLAAPYDEMSFSISPDGRWITYVSEETGRNEVYVRPFPNTADAKEQISADGGRGPLWSRDGRELFYLRGDTTMMAVKVSPGGTWQSGEPRPLFKLSPELARLDAQYYTPWDIARDGRFLFARSLRPANAERSVFVVIENWSEEVKARVPR